MTPTVTLLGRLTADPELDPTAPVPVLRLHLRAERDGHSPGNTAATYEVTATGRLAEHAGASLAAGDTAIVTGYIGQCVDPADQWPAGPPRVVISATAIGLSLTDHRIERTEPPQLDRDRPATSTTAL